MQIEPEWESCVDAVLSGRLTHQPDLHPIDFSSPSAATYVPVTKETVHYIVAAVIFNERRELLLVQEAKSSCYGQWYLPAGRMECNESLQEAVKREVEEESGLQFEPETLTSVEASAAQMWYRFTFTGIVTGGSLKTLAQRDGESLQARWCDMQLLKSKQQEFVLRSRDILDIIQIAARYRTSDIAIRHPVLLPCSVAHQKLLLRVVISHTLDSTNRILVSNTELAQFPVVLMHSRLALEAILRLLTKHIFGDSLLTLRLCGLLAVEHSGRPAGANDGVCLTVLVAVTAPAPLPTLDPDRYQWRPLPPQFAAAAALQHMTLCATPLILLS